MKKRRTDFTGYEIRCIRKFYTENGYESYTEITSEDYPNAYYQVFGIVFKGFSVLLAECQYKEDAELLYESLMKNIFNKYKKEKPNG